VKASNVSHKVIGYCHSPEKWEKALLITNNIEIVYNLGNKINQLIGKCGTKANLIEILKRCTTDNSIDQMTDDQLVDLWFHRWPLG
jgi:hypothetical protein